MAPDPTLTAQALVLVQAQAATREQISAATQASVAAALRLFLAERGGAGFFDAGAVTRLAKHLAATTRAGQRATSTSTAAYWARTVRLLTGRPVTPGRLVDVATVRPVPMDAVYGRLADQHRWLEASRGPATTPQVRLERAVESWTRKLQREALGPVLSAPELDLTPQQLATELDRLIADHAIPDVPPDVLTDGEIADRVIERSGLIVESTLSATVRAQILASAAKDPKSITGYRRVIHPELARSQESCGLCVAVSTRAFKRGDLAPLHDRCHCETIPIIGAHGGDGDVGGAINDLDLSQLYGDAGSTAARDLKRTRYAIEQHAELGPRLVAARAFATAGAGRPRTPKPPRPIPAVGAAAVLRAAERSVADLEARLAAGDGSARGPLAFQRTLAERMTAALAA